MNTAGIKHVIFDLGGVILNLSTQKTVEAFARLAGRPLQEINGSLMQSAQFHDYEKGQLSDGEFRNFVRQQLKIDSSDAAIDQCWNAMLLDIPLPRLQLLAKLRNQFDLFLLSNTNEIHLTCFSHRVLETTGHASLDSYFDAAYYSHRLKMQKPDREIFDFVLNQHSLNPSETLFLDDNPANLDGARIAGIHTFHVQHPDQLFTLFS